VAATLNKQTVQHLVTDAKSLCAPFMGTLNMLRTRCVVVVSVDKQTNKAISIAYGLMQNQSFFQIITILGPSSKVEFKHNKQ